MGLGPMEVVANPATTIDEETTPLVAFVRRSNSSSARLSLQPTGTRRRGFPWDTGC
jgi:hypothetical protein